MKLETAERHKEVAERLVRLILAAHGDVSVRNLCVEVGTSETVCRGAFVDLTGETIEEFSKRIRLERAACLLTGFNIPVWEVALDCGYSSCSTLDRPFGAHFGCSPRPFRELNPGAVYFPSFAHEYGFEPGVSAEFALDIACLKERNNILAVRKGMPAIGSVLNNSHGIEWLVDGHTSAPTLLRSGERDQEELYPAVIPQNLSKRLTEFAAEIDRCTPKVLVPLDTMPLMVPKRGHPGGHWVNAWSDPYRILLFIDAAHIHETVLAHELAHVWIDLVRGIEDYRVLKDKSNSARYAHVQFIQSFVLDIPVNQVIREKGSDLSVINSDAGFALKNLAESTSRGYCPQSKREAAFLGSFLATSMLAVEEQSPGIVRYQDSLLAIRPHLPDVYGLGERLASAIRDNPPITREAVRLAVDAALKASFEFCDENLDIDKELFEVVPEVAWNEDKHPEWLSGLSPQAKCEIGVAMAIKAASSNACYELSYAPNGKVRVRFEHDKGGSPTMRNLRTSRPCPAHQTRPRQTFRTHKLQALSRRPKETEGDRKI